VASTVTIETIAGTGIAGLGADNVDPLTSALYFPMDITVGPDGLLYILDWNNHRVRVIENGLVRTIIGSGLLGPADEGPGTSVNMNHPTNLCFGPDGNLYLAAWHNSKVMKYNMTTGYLHYYVNRDGVRGWGGDGGPAVDALVNLPSSCAFGPDGNLYVSDQANFCVRMVDFDTNIINTVVAVSHTAGFAGDGGPATDAQLNAPSGQAAYPSSFLGFDPVGNLLLCDTSNQRIRRVDAVTGIITTIAGSGTQGYAGDGGAATLASLYNPTDLAVNPVDGNLYIADSYNHVIRMVDGAGVITTVVGTGTSGYDGDGGIPTLAQLHRPWGIAFDAVGSLYIADTYNHVIRVVGPQALPVDRTTWGNVKSRFRGGSDEDE
jgi:sugar lactone lactonase YvrE